MMTIVRLIRAKRKGRDFLHLAFKIDVYFTIFTYFLVKSYDNTYIPYKSYVFFA
jgi:hypothetical protein